MTGMIGAPAASIHEWHGSGASSDRAFERLARHISQQEPRIHALVPESGRFDRLSREAKTCPRGELATVPVGVKDIFHVADLDTRAGSKLPPDELLGSEADCVTELKKAGAVILGKTVSTEVAYFAPGPTRNPRDTRHTPGGSSSGSAAAVAAGYCPIALGTQTIGSICRPASYCGVVGFKPSFDRISTSGVIPLAPSLDHVGILTTNLFDVTTTAAILVDRWEPHSLDRRPILGVPEGPYLERASARGLGHFRQVCDLLRADDWQVRSVELFDDLPQIEDRHHLIVAAEAARVHQDWFSRFGELYHPKTRELVERGSAITDQELAASLPELERLRQRIEEQMNEAEIDLWVSPAATGPAPSGIDTTGDPVMNLPWTQAGLPAISLPAGVDERGLPLGFQVVGRFWTDEALLTACALLETTLGRLP